MKSIVITTLPIKCDRDEVFKMAQDDRELIDAICQYSKKVKKEDKEVFARNKNIIAAEHGYFLALYEDELENINVKDPDEEQFEGEDGRMKMKLFDKEGNEHIEDVATLVAKTFVPNPFNHSYVKFKDNNPVNCNASNLYWSDTQ